MKCYRKGCDKEAAHFSMYCGLACQELERIEREKKEKEHEDHIASASERIRPPP